ncbi:MAG: hypothetical protein WCE73_13085 [Candidatus Angelobacter sp.]
MHTILRDFLLSFCPAKVRQAWRPSSQLTVLRAAMWGGLAQFLLTAFILIVQVKDFFILRLQQAAPHMGGVNSTGEAVVTVLVVLEFFFHPLSVFLLYVTLEGAVRFIGSLITAEIVPSLLVLLLFKLSDSTSGLVRRQRQDAAVADAVEHLPDRRIRLPQPRQSPTVTPASPLALTVDGLRWNAKNMLNRPVRTYMFFGLRRWGRFCAAIRRMTLPAH